MTASEGHSDTPRGYGVRGDVRKKLEGQHQAHPDAAVRDLMARAWDEGYTAAYLFERDKWYPKASNPYRSKP